MREITTKVYTFEELSDKAKEKARDWYREASAYDEWWQYVYEDAKRVGLKIMGFDIDRGSHVKAHFMASAEETAHLIEKEHGESCDTFKTAKVYLVARDASIDGADRGPDGEIKNTHELDEVLDELDDEFLKSLQEDYLVHLRNEYDYLMSDEQVDESITANEYEFTIDGKRA